MKERGILKKLPKPLAWTYVGASLAATLGIAAARPSSAETQAPPPSPTPITTLSADRQVYRIYGPIIMHGHKEASVKFPERIDRAEAKLTLFNRGKERGVKQGELFDNLVGFRRLGRSDLDLVKHFYDSEAQLVQETLSRWRSADNSSIKGIRYDDITRSIDVYDDQGRRVGTRQFPPTFEPGVLAFRLIEGRFLEFHMTLPVPFPGVKPDPLQVEMAEIFSNVIVMDIFSADETGRGALQRSREDRQLLTEIDRYFRDHPPFTVKPNMRLDQAAIRLVIQ